MEEFLKYLIAPAISALLTALLLSIFTWRWQQKYKKKEEIFELAMNTIAQKWTESYDLDLQNSKIVHKETNTVKTTNHTPEIEAQIQLARALVKAYFSEDTGKLYNSAINAKINLKDRPNEDAQQKADKVMYKMIDELERSRKLFGKL